MSKDAKLSTIVADYALGQDVEVGSDKKELLKAKVVGICLRGAGLTYECAWITSGDRKIGWFTSCEIRTRKSRKAPVMGFTNANVG